MKKKSNFWINIYLYFFMPVNIFLMALVVYTGYRDRDVNFYISLLLANIYLVLFCLSVVKRPYSYWCVLSFIILVCLSNVIYSFVEYTIGNSFQALDTASIVFAVCFGIYISRKRDYFENIDIAYSNQDETSKTEGRNVKQRNKKWVVIFLITAGVNFAVLYFNSFIYNDPFKFEYNFYIPEIGAYINAPDKYIENTSRKKEENELLLLTKNGSDNIWFSFDKNDIDPERVKLDSVYNLSDLSDEEIEERIPYFEDEYKSLYDGVNIQIISYEIIDTGLNKYICMGEREEYDDYIDSIVYEYITVKNNNFIFISGYSPDKDERILEMSEDVDSIFNSIVFQSDVNDLKSQTWILVIIYLLISILVHILPELIARFFVVDKPIMPEGAAFFLIAHNAIIIIAAVLLIIFEPRYCTSNLMVSFIIVTLIWIPIEYYTLITGRKTVGDHFVEEITKLHQEKKEEENLNKDNNIEVYLEELVKNHYSKEDDDYITEMMRHMPILTKQQGFCFLGVIIENHYKGKAKALSAFDRLVKNWLEKIKNDNSPAKSSRYRDIDIIVGFLCGVLCSNSVITKEESNDLSDKFDDLCNIYIKDAEEKELGKPIETHTLVDIDIVPVEPEYADDGWSYEEKREKEIIDFGVMNTQDEDIEYMKRLRSENNLLLPEHIMAYVGVLKYFKYKSYKEAIGSFDFLAKYWIKKASADGDIEKIRTIEIEIAYLSSLLGNEKYVSEEMANTMITTYYNICQEAKKNASYNEDEANTSLSESKQDYEQGYSNQYMNELVELKKLFESGIITQEEYNAKRKQILGI